MAPRANWKGYLKLGALSCPIALYTAASEGERIHLHTINRATGHRVRRQFVDEETGDVVERDDQAKGYEVGDGQFVVLEQEEIDRVIPESTRTVDVQAFVPSEGFDPIYLDRPYYLAPSEKLSREAFAVIRAAMESKGVLGIARAVLFRRDRAVALCPKGLSFIAFTLHYDYEVRAAAPLFDEIPALDVADEMVDLVKHIIAKKRGTFDPDAFEDRYEAALADLIKAKQAGKPVPRPKRVAQGNVVSLLDALRESAGVSGGKPTTGRSSGAKRKAAPGKPAVKGKAAAPRAKRRAG